MKPIKEIRYSVLVPVYNGERYIKACLDSLKNQTFDDFEVLIADDGSTDQSPLLIAPYLKNPRFQLLPIIRRQGLFKNVNRLLREARGKWIRVLCQDDQLAPQCLERELQFFEQHNEVGVLFSKSHSIDHYGKILSSGTLGDLGEVLPCSLALQQLYYHGCIPGNLSTVSFPRRVIEEVGLFNPSFTVSGDYEMWARICEKYPMGILHSHLVSIRQHHEQLSKARSSCIPCIQENRHIRKEIWKSLPRAIQDSALRYEKKRHNVLDVHQAIRDLVVGRWASAFGILRVLGLKDFLLGLFHWLVTLNNRYFYPRASWLIP